MSPEEINKKAYEKYPAKMAVVELKGQEPRQIDLNEEARNAYIEAYKEISALPTINGWVARDQDGLLTLFDSEPKRFPIDESWVGCGFTDLPKDLFPDLKWEDEPIEVELPIIRK